MNLPPLPFGIYAHDLREWAESLRAGDEIDTVCYVCDTSAKVTGVVNRDLADCLDLWAEAYEQDILKSRASK